MKYSLNDFKRAADRHVGDMEMSRAGRDRLTQPLRPRSSPLTWVGWAAAMAACLIMVLMFNIPVKPPAPDFPDDMHPGQTGGAHQLASGRATAVPEAAAPDGDAAGAPEPEGTAAAPEATAGMSTASGADTDPAISDVAKALTLEERMTLSRRTDAHWISYDYRGKPYYVNREPRYQDYTYTDTYDESDFYTQAEVLATEEGKSYYSDSDTDFFSRVLWPRPERVTYLPEFPNSSWQVYYSELGVGVVICQDADANGVQRCALADEDGLVTDFIYADLFEFTANGRAIASLQYEPDDTNSMREWGAINARGEWVSEPQLGYLEPLYIDLYGNGDSATAYYMLSTFSNYERVYDEKSDSWYSRSDDGPCYMLDTDGTVLFTAQNIDLTSSYSLEAPIRYQDMETGLWGYFDRNMSVVIPPKYRYSKPFINGLAAVEVQYDENSGGLYGFIDESGEMVIAPQFCDVQWGFTDNDTAQVRYSYDDVWHTIDRTGRDITSPVTLAWRRMLDFIGDIYLDARLLSLSVLCMALVLINAGRACGYRDGADAPRLRGNLGFDAMAAIVLAYAAIDESYHASSPGWLLQPNHGYGDGTYALMAILLTIAAVSGFTFGWSMRQRCRSRIALAAACVIMPLSLGGIRWLLGASTRMDIDIAAVLAISEALGARRPAYPDDEPARGFKERWLRPLLCALFAIAALALATWGWNGNGIITDVEYSVSELSDSGNIEFYTKWRDEQSQSEMELMYGENWQDDLNKILAAPDGYSAVNFDVTVKNRSLRNMRTTLVYFDTISLGYDTGGDKLREDIFMKYASDYAYASPAPFESETVSIRYIVAKSDLPEGEALDDALSELGKCFTVLH